MLKIIGSGSSSKISFVENETYIFLNTSHVRIEPKQQQIKFLFLSYGLLQTEKEINALEPINGKTKTETVSIRLGRINQQKKIAVQNLYCITPWDKKKVAKRLLGLDIRYENLTLIRDWRISLMLLTFLKFDFFRIFLDRNISFSDKIKIFPSLLPFLKIRPSTFLRPSTGMIAFLWVYNKQFIFSPGKIMLDGVGGKFDDENKNLWGVHHIDKQILNKISKIYR